MVKVLTIVISCEKHRNLWKDILDKQIDNLIIVCGGKFTTDFSLRDNILFLNCRDTYDGLPEKVICAHNAIANLERFNEITHILKVDDHDTIFTNDCIKRIEKYGEPLLSKNHYIGQHIYSRCIGGHHIDRCPNSRWNKRLYEGDNTSYASGGFSYILDRFASQKLIDEYSALDLKQIREKHIYEDLMVALIMKKHNIIPTKAYYGIDSTDPLYSDKVPISIRNAFHNMAL